MVEVVTMVEVTIEMMHASDCELVVRTHAPPKVSVHVLNHEDSDETIIEYKYQR
jgi:hypothetical protein